MNLLMLACLATATSAGLIVPSNRLYGRDLATVTNVLDAVSTGLTSLDQAVRSFSGDAKPVADASAELIQILKGGKTKVDASSNLTLNEALGLQQPVKDLQAKGQALLDDLKAKKADIVKNNLCNSTRKQVTDINTDSQALISSVIAKVPADAQAIAKSLADGLVQVLNSAQAEFSEANCKDSGGSATTSQVGTTTISSATGTTLISAPSTTATVSLSGTTTTSDTPVATTSSAPRTTNTTCARSTTRTALTRTTTKTACVPTATANFLLSCLMKCF